MKNNSKFADSFLTTHLAEHIAALQHDATISGAPPLRPFKAFGLDFIDTTVDTCANWMLTRAEHGLKTQVGFINAHCVNVAHRRPDYRHALSKFDGLFADGIGVKIAMKLAGQSLRDNVNGTDLFPVLCDKAARTGARIYLLGAAEGIAGEAARRMCERFPGLAVAGSRNGFFSDRDDEAKAIATINASGADIVLIAMGVPLQETWIARNAHRLNAPVIAGVGGLFDYYSGRIARAPKALRLAGLEWAWRLSMEPSRLANRYLIGNTEFLVRLAAVRAIAPQGLLRTEYA